jgi:hypothetical protein
MTDREQATDRPRTALSEIEPIRSTAALGDDGIPGPDLDDVDRVGRNAAAAMGSTPAVGVTAEADEEVREHTEPNEELRRG